MNLSSTALFADNGGCYGDRNWLQVQDQGQGDDNQPSYELSGARYEMVIRIQEGDTLKRDIETLLSSFSGYNSRNLH